MKHTNFQNISPKEIREKWARVFFACMFVTSYNFETTTHACVSMALWRHWRVWDILVPRAFDPSGLRQESRALGATISGMRHRWRLRETGWAEFGYFLCYLKWLLPELSIPAAGQKDCRLWERECGGRRVLSPLRHPWWFSKFNNLKLSVWTPISTYSFEPRGHQRYPCQTLQV